MGWASGGEVFEPVAYALLRGAAMRQCSDTVITDVLSTLIVRLEDRGWDTQDESLGEFQDVPAIVAAFNRVGIQLDTHDEDE